MTCYLFKLKKALGEKEKYQNKLKEILANSFFTKHMHLSVYARRGHISSL